MKNINELALLYMIWCIVLIVIAMARNTQLIKERLAPVYKHTTTTVRKKRVKSVICMLF